ncbi:ABC transporter permease/substrate-binding protein [Halalkalibacter nanhaiisediminis]|uniref:Osmoprotectant transport system permease protein n=1 Tax=Halalkalibacter nanhaiisediminis TaxID=688079 RepID=A0A562QQG0_9BACI|nr:ABC transporter permease/substrate-binding protein [Halalkalibacter nanhaiisediminis]TWI58988.1 osmoprotectant transport system permease protein [Halalkalibacter nanhaiisediminis]
MEGIQRLIDLFLLRQDLVWSSLWQHLQLSLISLLIAVFIAVPLGVILSRKKRFAEFIIGVTAVLQTIPSLALLGFMILFVGIGTTPAIIALTAYALLPILRNTYTGINEVDPAIREAATGMGMNSIRRLLKVELPIAMPTVMAGVRTSMVLIVGTATLAALIGAGGLGDLIMIGIQRANNEYILLGAIPAALLALFFDFILRVTQNKTRGSSYKPIIALVTLAIAFIIVPPLFAEDDGYDLVIGGKLNAEPEIVANMYKHLIEEETDLRVDVQAGLGGTDIVFNALRVGDIDMYLEFSGTILGGILNVEDFSYEPREAYEQARDLIYEAEQFVFLEPMAYQNTYAIAVTNEFAEETGVETISDLRPFRDQLTAGFTFEFIDRQDGYAGFEELYGFRFADVQTMDASLRARALVSEDVQVIDAYSTDSQLVKYNLKVLEDDQQLFPPYQGAPLVREETLIRYPELESILEQLAGQVTEEEIQRLNYLVDYEDQSAEAVARDYLEEHGYIH